MAKNKDVHTVPNPSGKGWVNKVAGDTVSKHRRKDTAVERGREIADEKQSEHVIHRKDGVISQKHSHGPDPNPPRDKR